MTQTEFLFIGGEIDGKRLAIERVDHVIKFPKMSYTPAHFVVEESSPLTQTIEAEEYFLSRIKAGEQKFFYYRLSSLKEEEVIQLLLDNYRLSDSPNP